MTKQIKDPVHGYIEVPDALLPLLDTALVQRLHAIRQLGFAYLVYPGANHTRFEHSLGTMALADKVCRSLDLPDDERLLVTASALIHDIGHGPFSHASERLAQEFGEFSHDDILPYSADLKPCFDELGADVKEAAAIISGTHRLASIIHGDLDVDRMDYLLRDAHYTGVPYGTLDANRLIHSLSLDSDEGLFLKEEGLSAAESLLIARTLMGPSAYYHHVSRIAEEMFLLAGKRVFTNQSIRAFLRMDDAAALMLLATSHSDSARALISRIRTRRLYKRAVYVGRNQVNMERMTSIRPEEKERIRLEIAEKANVKEEYVILDIPAIRREMHMQVRVRNLHDFVPFEDIVPLLNLMNQTRKEQWRLGVYTVPEYRDTVSAAAMSVLGIQKPTKQYKLSDIIVEEK
ncbi:MAG TPA: HD domain-containing protein [Methanocorpusculum sp.]|nr:HD domain-containing protein [Methanocorpusculum sp.]